MRRQQQDNRETTRRQQGDNEDIMRRQQGDNRRETTFSLTVNFDVHGSGLDSLHVSGLTLILSLIRQTQRRESELASFTPLHSPTVCCPEGPGDARFRVSLCWTVKSERRSGPLDDKV